MTLNASTIKPAVGAKKDVKRLGRGNGSQRGSYCGRGGKGQTARSGGKSRTQIRAFKSSLQKVPKLRGFKSKDAKEETVTLRTLERAFNNGEIVTPKLLKLKGIIGKSDIGVKILASGEITKKLSIQSCVASKKAVEMIEKAGGSIKF